MDVSMFEIIQHIGLGAYGKVSLVKKVSNLMKMEENPILWRNESKQIDLH